LTCQDRSGGDQFELTQEFLAEMLGVSRPIVSTTAAIPHQKTAGSPLALKDQGDSLDLLIMDYHQRGDECCHKVC
jgi:hypothetical protein